MSAATPDDIILDSTDRRREVRAHHHNGLDLVEVAENRRQLTLMFLEQTPQRISAANIRIDGPPDQPSVAVTSARRVSSSDPKLRDHVVVDLSRAGREGTYRVSIVEARPDGTPGTAPLSGLDPWFTSCSVRFDIDQPLPAGVAATTPAPAPPPAPAPSYLARDFEGLRQLLVDGLTQAMPDWTETHIPDLMIMLVELFAYVGDDLSYYQDSIATEAYLQTARQRTSIRRHARLVGYRFHEGCHARAWIDAQVRADCDLPLQDISFSAHTATATTTFTPLRATLPAPYAPGETVRGEATGPVIPLRIAHNEIAIWGWGESSSYLPVGATEATLAEPEDTSAGRLQLQPGDVVMFEEKAGAGGVPADETHRHVVRLTRVVSTRDDLLGRDLVEIGWDPLDALPFRVQVTTPSPEGPDPTPCSVARANLILVGEGQRITSEQVDPQHPVLPHPDLTWSCPYPDLDRVAVHQAFLLSNLYDTWRAQLTTWRRRAGRGHPLDGHQRAELTAQFGKDLIDELGLGADPGAPDEDKAESDARELGALLARAEDLLESRRRRLEVLSHLAAASGPLAGPLIAEVRQDWGQYLTRGLDPHQTAAWGQAVDATTQDPRSARPVLTLTDAQPDDTQTSPVWEITTDLVDAEPESRRVIVEMDNDRTAHLRFNPATDPPGTLLATYLIGNGAAGNVAAETITGWLPTGTGAVPAANISSVRNPLPATGGCDPENMDHARRAIPGAYLDDQPRALTPADYVAIAQRVPGVRNAAAALTWSGNQLGIRVAVQPDVGEDPGRLLLARVEHNLVSARRIGHDLRVSPPDYRAVAIKLGVELDANTIRDITREQIARLLSSGLLRNGRPAFFHPAYFSFGDPLYQSALVAAVQELAGVVSVTVTEMRFVTTHLAPYANPAPDVLTVSPTGIIRCDNEPAAPDNGYVQVTLVGGR
jgi:predicted phage baseplate assembly protein